MMPIPFLPYDAGFQGGVYVAAGDVNGDGIVDIVTGVGGDDSSSAPSHVKVFDGQTGVHPELILYGTYGGDPLQFSL